MQRANAGQALPRSITYPRSEPRVCRKVQAEPHKSPSARKCDGKRGSKARNAPALRGWRGLRECPALTPLPEGRPFDKLGGTNTLNEGWMPPQALCFDWFETLGTEFDPSRRPNGGLL